MQQLCERTPSLRQPASRMQSDHYAVAHKDIIDLFGRSPHHNTILGRRSTPEEIAFLLQPGSSF